jgi:hypothetical protein
MNSVTGQVHTWAGIVTAEQVHRNNTDDTVLNAANRYLLLRKKDLNTRIAALNEQVAGHCDQPRFPGLSGLTRRRAARGRLCHACEKAARDADGSRTELQDITDAGAALNGNQRVRLLTVVTDYRANRFAMLPLGGLAVTVIVCAVVVSMTVAAVAGLIVSAVAQPLVQQIAAGAGAVALLLAGACFPWRLLRPGRSRKRLDRRAARAGYAHAAVEDVAYHRYLAGLTLLQRIAVQDDVPQQVHAATLALRDDLNRTVIQTGTPATAGPAHQRMVGLIRQARELRDAVTRLQAEQFLTTATLDPMVEQAHTAIGEQITVLHELGR